MNATARRRAPAPTGGWTRRRVLIVGGLAALVAVAGAAWLLWPSPSPPPPRARQYLEFTACLLTGPQGIAGRDAAPVWAGMQQASLATHAKVQYVSVTEPQTTENASAFLASLARGNCDLVFTTGAKPAAAADRDAGAYPDVTFYVLGRGTDASNLTHVDGSTAAEVQARADDIIRKAAGASPH
jgi:basic membrane lipoprotein Med (substrate-binding protein (PBP1-ABC) superfamily)